VIWVTLVLPPSVQVILKLSRPTDCSAELEVYAIRDASVYWSSAIRFADFFGAPEVSYQQFGCAPNCNFIESLYATLYHDNASLALPPSESLSSTARGLKGVCPALGRFICTEHRPSHRLR